MRKSVLFLLLLAITGVVLQPHIVTAQSPSIDSGSRIATVIQQNCSTVRGAIKRIHTNDAVTRVNIGQRYNIISVQLMARFNSRLSLNRMDASKLVSLTNQFESARTQFKTDYNNYDSIMSDLDKTNCLDEPVGFYERLVKAREARQQLAKDIEQLNRLAEYYRNETQVILKSLEGGNG